MRRALFVLVSLLALAGAARAGDPPRQPTPTTTPPTTEAPLSPVAQGVRIESQVYIGEPAPDFELDGSEGRPVRLAHLKGYWILLVFEDRRHDLAPLRAKEPELRRLGVKPIGMCADKAHVLRTFAANQHLPFVLLSDVTGEISQLYGLYDAQMSHVRSGFVLIDRRGVVRMALLGERLPYEDMMGLVRRSVTGS
jgi:peroxiredoxin Q/BCP